jgi:hypothetical protein
MRDKSMKKEKLTEYELKLANEIKRALLNNKRDKMLVYISRVSKSGMSRNIRFTFIDSYGSPVYPDYIFSKLGIGTYTGEYGIRVRGCGMDMVFHTLDCFLSCMGVKDAYKWAHNYTMI